MVIEEHTHETVKGSKESNGFRLQTPHIPGSPWWAQLLLFVIGWLGPSIVIAALFVAMWAGWITSPITTNTLILHKIEGKLDTHMIAFSQTMAADLKADEQRSLVQERILNVLSVMCRNAANTTLDRDRCEGYWRKP